MNELKKLKTGMLIELAICNKKIRQCWVAKDTKNIKYHEGKRNVLDKYIKEINSMIEKELK